MTHRTDPLQNRVDPWGELRPVKAHGQLMGNRGQLHDENDDIVRRWKTKAWVTCILEETFQKRSPFSPNTYSELFFLDEATAYAAGHRPCRTCQRDRHDLFNQHWTAANAPAALAAGQQRLPIRHIDAQLHAERVSADRGKRTQPARWPGLPVGAMFAHQGQAWLVAPSGARRWSFSGYQPGDAPPADAVVELLTPPSVVAALRQGLPVNLHPSAG